MFCNDYEQISQEKFQEILMKNYKKGEETENIRAIDLINDIKQQLMFVMNIQRKTTIEK